MAFWLMVANLALAGVVVASLASAFWAVLFHLVARTRRRARMARELERYLRRALNPELNTAMTAEPRQA